jgi:glutamate 5-kinase
MKLTVTTRRAPHSDNGQSLRTPCRDDWCGLSDACCDVDGFSIPINRAPETDAQRYDIVDKGIPKIEGQAGDAGFRSFKGEAKTKLTRRQNSSKMRDVAWLIALGTQQSKKSLTMVGVARGSQRKQTRRIARKRWISRR